MAVGKLALEAVEVGTAPIERYRPIVGDAAWTEFQGAMQHLTAKLSGRIVWNVNSTARGGGVAELLGSLIPYSRGAGIDERWAVIDGFFDVTKKLHMLLHGVAPDGSEIACEERELYEQTMERNAAALAELVRPGDFVLLHDPQTAGLAPALKRRGCRIIWRSHIGADQPNELVRSAQRMLCAYLGEADAYVFSRRTYAWDALDQSRVRIMAPCIDPFTTKNQDLDGASVTSILRACGIVQGPVGEATFLRHDGAASRVRRAATVTRALPPDARIVVQVSRWDRLKDPVGVMRGFADHVAPQTDRWLVLAGPSVHSVDDDPDQPEILRRLESTRAELPPPSRDRVVVAQLPMQDLEENAAVVNALQRRAEVVVQKSLAEGFGLTVAEAMWKARPVVASRVGGIEDQVEDGKSGVLIDDPRDLRSFGQAVVGLLRDQARAEQLGREARRRIAQHFLAPRHLVEQAQLITGLD